MTDKILIVDDEDGNAKAWRDQLAKVLVDDRFELDVLPHNSFKSSIEALQSRRLSARGEAVPCDPEPSEFDDVAVLIIDYDLLRFDPGSAETGEAVAYVARCYSNCELIIALNQYKPNNGFDLRLRGHPESFADLNLAGVQLSNPGLWYEPFAGFRPWTWPLIPKALDDYRARLAELQGNLDEPILEFLGMAPEVRDRLPRSVAQFLGPHKHPEAATFRGFVTESGYGLRLRDVAAGDPDIARIAAARVFKGLERLILAGQDILIDAPHLVARFPSLLAGNKNDAAAWNQTARLSAPLQDLGVAHGVIRDWLFNHPAWLSRPAWYWHGITDTRAVEEVAHPWTAQRAPYAFCEDLSRFVPPEAAREFAAEVTSQFVRRFTLNPESEHAKRLIADLDDNGDLSDAKDFRKVAYHPEVRFAM